MGLDEHKNSKDEVKAMRAYGGMTKEDLIKHVGQPKEKFLDEMRSGDPVEIWVYGADKVLRGGRVLYITLPEGRVYYTSIYTMWLKEDDWTLLE